MKSKIKKVQNQLDAIYEAIAIDGPYSHNIIGLALSEIANLKGIKYANRVVDELREDYGIHFTKAGVEE